MKLSFSTNKWSKFDFDDFIKTASEYRFDGIELHSIRELDGLSLDDAVQKAAHYGIAVPCIDLTRDVSVPCEELDDEFEAAVAAALRFHAPYIRLKASQSADEFIKTHLPVAEKYSLTLLVETAGKYSDTALLRELLTEFACDNLGALWDFHYPFREMHESPETTITNLGAYVKHVHIKDSDGLYEYSLIGEGSLPIDRFIGALRSINYDGYCSLEWNPEWVGEVDDINIIFPHYVSFMSRYSNLSRSEPVFYENRAKTGKFVWKKDTLIDKTFSQVLDTMAEHFPDRCAIRYTTLNYTRTYREFRNDVDAFAKGLLALGVKAGSHVAVWATNVPEWYIAFWAVTKIGAVLVSMNTAYKIHEAEYLLKQSDTHTLILIEGYRDSDYAGIVRELCPELEKRRGSDRLHSKKLPFLRNVITVGYSQKGALTWDEAVAAGSTVRDSELERVASAVDPHDVCNMQYTSGTTGFPKGVMLTHHNIVNNGKCIGDRMDLSTADRMMIQVPMFHCFGMVLAMTAAMTHAASIYPLPYFTPKPALSCINNEHITAFHGVPTMFIAMLEHPDFAKTDFSCMRTGIMAGSPCPEAVMKQVVEKMHMSEITIVYGQTESSPGCTMSSTDDPISVRVSTVGRALPEIECRIVDPETNAELPDNTTGEFVARGYNIMKGYYKMPEATAKAIDSDGWLHTGDLALRTPDGNYRITGRLKDMIIRGGENIYPKEIEEFIYTHPKVSDVQVIGIPDEQYGEEIMACIILKDKEQITTDEMREYIRTHLAKHKVPKYIDFVNEFPTNAAGKILKYKMREEAAKRLGIKKIDGIVTKDEQ